MSDPVNIRKHPIHPMLIPFPIGWWVFSLILDCMAVSGADPVWCQFARFTIVAGIIAALAAALPGALDLYGMRSSTTKKLGIWHMSINLVVTTLFIIGFIWRSRTQPAAAGPIILSVVAVLLLIGSGWLGGEMVYVHGAGVNSPGEKR